MNDFEAAVYEQLSFYPPETVFVASVSGGADSTAMLAALAAIRNEKSAADKFILRCIHVEHGIRAPEESRGDALAVKALCKKLKIPCKIAHIPSGKIAETASKRNLGIEAAARFYRQKVWKRELQHFHRGVILTAHTKDDLLETMLMRFFRGAGPAGLASIRHKNGAILRPLLYLNRADVISYLKTRGLSYCTDSTNEDLSYLRNRIRHKLIPFLDEEFAFWRSALEFSGETQRLTADFLSSEAERRLKWEKNGINFRIPFGRFNSEPAIIREESIFQAADRLETPDFRSLRRKSLRRFIRELENGCSAGDLGPVRAEKISDSVILKNAPKPEFSSGFALLIKDCGSYNLNHKFQIKAAKYGERAEPGDGNWFYVRLPLVFRGETGFSSEGKKFRFSGILRKAGDYNGEIITAEDNQGIAALIAADGDSLRLLFRREDDRLLAQKEQAYLVELRGRDV